MNPTPTTETPVTARRPHYEMVYEILPAPGEHPVRVHALAQQLPLTLAEVSAALQVLKRDGRAVNPRGRKTNSWTRDEPAPAPVEPEAHPELPAPSEVDPRILEVERHLARIEGALAGISSRLDEAIELLEQSAEREKIIVGSVTPAKEALR